MLEKNVEQGRSATQWKARHSCENVKMMKTRLVPSLLVSAAEEAAGPLACLVPLPGGGRWSWALLRQKVEALPRRKEDERRKGGAFGRPAPSMATYGGAEV